VPTTPAAVTWLFLSATIVLVAIVLALGVALVVYQRRFLTMHRQYADNLVKAHEDDRAWIAREVHDDALQRIVLLMHELDSWAGASGGSRAAALSPTRTAGLRAELEDLAMVLRRMAYRLHPAFVEQGIEQALRQLTAELSRTANLTVDIHTQWALPPALNADQALVVFRVAQEALMNCARHSGVRRASITLAAPRGGLDMRVEDSGAGFDVEPARRAGGLGLISMSERARVAGGSLSIISQPGGGTVIELRLPLGEQAGD
jgi:signal transduction histidine kinase